MEASEIDFITKNLPLLVLSTKNVAQLFTSIVNETGWNLRQGGDELPDDLRIENFYRSCTKVLSYFQLKSVIKKNGLEQALRILNAYKGPPLVESLCSLSYNVNTVLASPFTYIEIYPDVKENLVVCKLFCTSFWHERIEREVSKLRELKQITNVLRFHTVETVFNKYVLLSAEFCFLTLEDFIENKAFPEGINKLDICKQITTGLNYLHANNIIHRDLRPSCIFVEQKSGKSVTAKIFYTGICAILDKDEFHDRIAAADLEGLTYWLGPEVLKYVDGMEIPMITKTMDIFPLGCIFYYILSGGEHPFEKGPYCGRNILRGKFELKTEMLGEGKHVRPLIKSMILSEATKRPSCQDVLDQLISNLIRLESQVNTSFQVYGSPDTRTQRRSDENKSQQAFIARRLPFLTNTVNCSDALLMELSKFGVLSSQEILDNKCKTSEFARAAHLLTLLQSKALVLEPLKKALRQDRQDILFRMMCQYRGEEKLTQCGQIYYNKNVVLCSKGIYGSIVYEGKVGSRLVAAKLFKFACCNELLSPDLIMMTHPNLCQIIQSEKVDGSRILIAMELCMSSLADCIREKQLPLTQAVILKQSTLGLQYLHSKAIIHGNIKATNILISVTDNGEMVVKLADYGGVGSGDGQPKQLSVRTSENDVCQLGHTLQPLIPLRFQPCVLPFWDMLGRIKFSNRRMDAQQKCDIKLVSKVIRSMTNTCPSKRPTCGRILDMVDGFRERKEPGSSEIFSESDRSARRQERNVNVGPDSSDSLDSTECVKENFNDITLSPSVTRRIKRNASEDFLETSLASSLRHSENSSVTSYGMC